MSQSYNVQSGELTELIYHFDSSVYDTDLQVHTRKSTYAVNRPTPPPPRHDQPNDTYNQYKY